MTKIALSFNNGVPHSNKGKFKVTPAGHRHTHHIEPLITGLHAMENGHSQME